MKPSLPRLIPSPWAWALALGLLPVLALAQEEATIDSGDTAWLLTATALVLFMTIPGLALFYGGWCAPRTSFRCSCSASASPH